MVAAPRFVLVSNGAVFQFCAKATVGLLHVPPEMEHASCQRPWSWLLMSTVQAKVSPELGFTASAPRKMGHAIEPRVPRLVGHRLTVRPLPGCAAMRVQVIPSLD